MADEHFSRRSLLGLLGGVGATVLGKQGDALAAALGGASPEKRAAAAGGDDLRAAAAAPAADAAEQDGAVQALPLAQPVLDAGPGQPPIVARRAWAGADHPPVRAPEYGTVELAFVHHTDNPNGYSPAEVPALLRAIYVDHRYGRGWNDIGYNFVIDRFGRIFEARAGGIDEPVVGAQAGGYNGFSTGIAVLGDYEAIRVSTAARQALRHLIAWKLSLHGVPADGELTVHCESGGAVYSRFPADAAVRLDRVSGHRQADATTCPGDALYAQLKEVRRLAAKLAGRPTAVTLAIAPAPAPAPAPVSAPGREASEEAEAKEEAKAKAAAVRQRTLSGTVSFLDGTPVGQAPIEIQVREDSQHGEKVQERTIATTATDAQGAFSVPLSVEPDRARPKPAKGAAGRPAPAQAEHTTSLRALCPGTADLPASISPPLAIAAKLDAGSSG